MLGTMSMFHLILDLEVPSLSTKDVAVLNSPSITKGLPQTGGHERHSSNHTERQYDVLIS